MVQIESGKIITDFVTGELFCVSSIITVDSVPILESAATSVVICYQRSKHQNMSNKL